MNNYNKGNLKNLLVIISVILLKDCLSQESIFFNITIQPTSEYIEKTRITINSTAEAETESNKNALKLDEIQIPKIKEITSISHIVSFERDTLKEQQFPIEIEFVSFEVNGNGNSKKLPPEIIMYARAVERGIYQIDSISGKNIPPVIKRDLVQTMNHFFKQYCLPAGKVMKIGDTYIHEFTYEVYFSELPVTINSQVIYTLIEIRNDVAYFTFTTQSEYSQKKYTAKDFADIFDYFDYKFITDNPKTIFMLNGNASGSGNLVYNTKTKMIETQSTSSIAAITFENQHFRATIHQIIDFEVTIETISTENK